VLNARFNFRVSDKIPLRLGSFFGVALLGWAVSAMLLYLLIGKFGFDKYLSKLAVLAVVVLLQYNLNRLVSFRKAN
jgi:putative flippase GtrA